MPAAGATSTNAGASLTGEDATDRIIRSVRIEGLRRFLHPAQSDVTFGELAGRYAAASALTRATLEQLSGAATRQYSHVPYVTLSRGIIESGAGDEQRVEDALATIRDDLTAISPRLELVTVAERATAAYLRAAQSAELLRRLNAPGRKDRTDFEDGERSADFRALVAIARAYSDGGAAFRTRNRLAAAARDLVGSPARLGRSHPQWTLSLEGAADTGLAWVRLDASGFLDLVTEAGAASWIAARSHGAALATWYANLPALIHDFEAAVPATSKSLVLHSLSDDIVLVCLQSRVDQVAGQVARAFGAIGGNLRWGAAAIAAGVSAADVGRAANAALGSGLLNLLRSR